MNKINVRLTFDGPFNVGSGALGGALADKPLTRDARGLPMIPASSLKGRLRHEIERMLPILYPDERTPCASPQAETMCQGDQEPCLVCQLFGSPWYPGKLVFSDLTLVEPKFLVEGEPPAGDLRYGVGLSRHRRVAEDQLLYTTEVFLPGVPVTLEGAITGDWDKDELALLQSGLKSLFAVGGGKTQGLGWFEMSIEVCQDVHSDTVFVDQTGLQSTFLEVVVQLDSSLLLGTESNEAYYKRTRTYIPGSTLRGALAQLMLSGIDPTRIPPDSDFAHLFNATSVLVFENLYPTTSGRKELSFPPPLTARSCKYHPGFSQPAIRGEERHGVGDILIRQAVFERMLDDGVECPVLYCPRCPVCGGRVDEFERFVVMVTANQFDSIDVPVRRTSRTAINRQRAVAADGLLYTLEVVEPLDEARRPITFRGRVQGTPQQLEILSRWLPQVSSIGGGKSRGLGRLKVTLKAPEELPNPLPSLEERLTAFNERVHQEWGFYERVAGARPLPDGEYWFCLDLLSPAILIWRGVPVTAPPPEMLGFENCVNLLRAFAGYGIAGGWHAGARLPRRKQMTVEMGSVFLYRSKGLSIADLVNNLANLGHLGLGQERERGLGHVVACLPFHYRPEVEL